jgi:WD40 repeat protein
VWNLETGDCLHTLTGHTDGVQEVAVAELEGHPHAITASLDGTARVWNLETGDCLHTLTGHTVWWVLAVVVAELDGRPHAVITSLEGAARVWDLETGLERDTLYLPYLAGAITASPASATTLVLGVGSDVIAMQYNPRGADND